MTDPALLTISSGIDSECGLNLHRKVCDRDEIDAPCFRAVHGEIVDLAVVVAPSRNRPPMMEIGARSREPNRPLPEPPGLALDTR